MKLFFLKKDDPKIVIKKLEDLPERENMYLENAFKKKETTVTLKDKTVDLTTMKIYPTSQPNKKDNVVRKEKFKGKCMCMMFMLLK